MSIDSVMELSESFRYDTAMTVVNSLSKQVYLILTHTTITVKEVV